ncbi:uncharacterized protein LOC110461227 [Mizuhopecten yessoensis]|uniref:uncharacterized protein LOC110461227 n=1 Tax=Mizuhopecten yessoensis TaxID=6573 RepID=UPI000B458C0B|nr:uncharacterized protein LOC110461227 [Mizuhopecten yessoensis]
MASTLATRVGAGTVIAVGIVIVSFILWRKKKRGKPKDAIPSTPGGVVKPSVEKDTTVSASGDAFFPRKSVTPNQGVSAGQADGDVTGAGDGSGSDNYVCEDGMCRLVKEPWKTTKAKQKVRFDPLAEDMTKSLTEFFEGRTEPEKGTEENGKVAKPENTVIDRKETCQQKEVKDTLQCVKPEQESSVIVESVSRTVCAEPMIQPSEGNKVTSDMPSQNQLASEVNTQQGHGLEKVITDQGQRSSEKGQGEESMETETNGLVAGSYEEEDEVWEVGRYEEEDISMAILVSQNSPGILSRSNAEILVALLSHPETKLLKAALNGIKKSSTFTRNQNLFRQHGCLEKLSKLLRSQSMSLRHGVKSSREVVSSVATAITNLSANTENHKNLESCVPTLVDLTLEDETGESVCLSSLQALTNLSLTDQYHRHYTRLIQKLYDLLDTNQHNIQLQALKVLVNLSCSTEMVPHILAAKAPGCLLELLKQGSDEALILRMTTFLANILHTVREENLSVSSLPPDDKAPSPETMYSALYSMNNVGAIKSKVFLLCRHRNEDIKVQATRIYQSIAK